METIDILKKIVEKAEEKKGENIVALEIGKISPIADYMVILSGSVPVHTRAICDNIIAGLKEYGVIPQHLEGYNEGRWIAIDYGDIMVNIFLPEIRDYYKLEWLWSDAPQVELSTTFKESN
ncbi:MAG: ribosome silencing factor [Sulfurihydrogenibium sp.]|jgi:ribosome-associated protein|uniref:ribosome silencing factor n=1 Tax=Sulfurihydrogenibium sp. TaxID=2053621 RepID=UPI000CC8EB91|nr:MAG: ribosome silencing factor [Sulfurihydrogenibium sp.]PMP77932.1 MAG: ribosome silencing factor [Sulfurihydrogenibium sp.]